MLRIKLEEVEHGDKEKVETEIFTQEYLIKRPLLEAIQSDGANPPVLLIDEIDRADMEFEAFLLEVLVGFSDHHSRNRHDQRQAPALCFSYIEPDAGNPRRAQAPLPVPLDRISRLSKRNTRSSRPSFPEVEANMAKQICAFMQRVREMNFYKRPGVAETLDWASALIALNRKGLDDKTVVETMGCVFKYREDLHHLREQVEGKQLNLEALLRVSPEMVS